MRKIERDMIAAIRSGKNWTQGNTSVIHDPVIGATECEVRLHGNLIAKHILRTGWTMSLAGWGTPTTRSRLNAIGHAFYDGAGFGQRDHAQIYYSNAQDHNGREVAATAWVNVGHVMVPA